MDRAPVKCSTLVRLALAGSALASSIWLVDLLPDTYWKVYEHGSVVMRLAISLSVLLPGFALSICSERLLKKRVKLHGHDADDEDLLAARSLLDRSFWRWLGLGFAAGSLLLSMLARRNSALNLVYLLFYPFRVHKQLVRLLAPAPDRQLRSGYRTADWSSFKPIQSSHWGQPPHNRP